MLMGYSYNNTQIHLSDYRYYKRKLFRDSFQIPANTTANNDNNGLAVAIVITLTSDLSHGSSGYLDSAAVLEHSIRTHVHGGKYSKVHTIVLCGPNTTTWSSDTWIKVAKAGWEPKRVELPVSLNEIENKGFRKEVQNSGCCGEAEFIKLHAFSLVEYDRVMLLDADSFILQPVDELFFEERSDAVWTVDTFLGGNCINGGFLVFHPSTEVYSRMIEIVRKGDFQGWRGWEGKGIGYCYGGQTFQGIIPHYYRNVHPAPIVDGNTKWKSENNCRYNNLGLGRCFSKDEEGRDGRHNGTYYEQENTTFSQIKLAHFTGRCAKPFKNEACHPDSDHCTRLYEAWWKARNSLEQLRLGNITRRCEQGVYSPLRIF